MKKAKSPRRTVKRRSAEAKPVEYRQVFEDLLGNLPGMAYRCRDAGHGSFEFISQGGVELTGHPLSHLRQNKVSYEEQIIHPEDRETARRKLQAALHRKETFQLVYRILTRKGAEKWVLDQGRGTYSANGKPEALEGFVTDITDRKKAEEIVSEQAIRDTLTGLYNRRHFEERLKEAMAWADRDGHLFGLLLCDLDGFKAINDSKGHHTGDEALKAAAKTIQDSTRGTDLAFRWGGDEIAVVLANPTRAGALVAAKRIRNGIQKTAKQMRLDLDVSIGIAYYPEHGKNVDEMIRKADRALYIAKKTGDKIHIGVEDYELNENTVKVVFQPLMDVWSDEVMGYEALSRDAEGKLTVSELFRKHNAVGQLSELKQICFKSQMKAAQELGLPRLFVNVDFDVLGQLETILKPPEMEVILELSELEAIQNLERHLQVAKKWRAAGYKFAIDDFGAGFISLPFIARLVPEYIKVDRSTMLQAVSSKIFRGFMKPLLVALRNYATEGIIAEGIEDKKELDAVKEMGIFLVQGFLLGRPKEMK